jgi:hypothetical protein
MRYKAVFIAGAAVGFVAGTRAGRDVYDKMMGYGKQVAQHPKVQQATKTATAKGQEYAKTAAAKAPGYCKNAASSVGKTAQSQASALPGYMTNAKNAAASRIPSRFSRSGSKTEPADAATTVDDVAPDGSLLYPMDEASPSSNGIRYTPRSAQ